MINTAARLVRAHLDFCTSCVKHNNLLFYRRDLYVTLTQYCYILHSVRAKLISFFTLWN